MYCTYYDFYHTDKLTTNTICMYVNIYHRSTTTNNNKIIKSPEKRKQQQIKVFS